MKEALLHYIWQFGKYNQANLKTFEGETLTVINTGFPNHHAGPDFSQARIKIGDTEWAGNVEIHVKTSDWYAHGHETDQNYESVILHVVWEHDKDSFHLPTLELKDLVSNILLQRYGQLMLSQQFVPCAVHLPELNEFNWMNWKERLLAERLEDKAARISKSLAVNQNHWQQSFYEQLAYSFGLKTNEHAFEELAKRVPLKLIGKHRSKPTQIEAMLFGTASLLPEYGELEYSKRLRYEYGFLRDKYKLKPMKKPMWNFGRVRPASLPTLRIAQFATLITQSNALFSKVMEPLTVKELYTYFDTTHSSFWETHYTFDKPSAKKIKPLGKQKIKQILINTVAPFQFLYGKHRANEVLISHSLQLLRELSPEKNRITEQWSQHGITNKTAFDSQALIHLYNDYCMEKQCLSCRVGHSIFSKEANFNT